MQTQNDFMETSNVKDYNLQCEMPLLCKIERMKYLERKMEKVKEQYQKQQNAISKIQTSSHWRTKDDCDKQSCYHRKYMQLLRVKSPYY